MILNIVPKLISLIFIINLWSRYYYYLPLTDEESTDYEGKEHAQAVELGF